MSIAYQVLASRSEAEEAVQETFIAGVATGRELRHEPWRCDGGIATIVRNRALDRRARCAASGRAVARSGDGADAQFGPTPAESPRKRLRAR